MCIRDRDSWDRVYGIMSSVLPDKYQVSRPGAKAHKLARVIQESNPDSMYRTLVSQWKDVSEIIDRSWEPETIKTNEGDSIYAMDVEHRMMLLDGLTYLPDDLLVKVDRAAMGEGLETRMPLLDHRVVELAWAIPLHSKIKKGMGKIILREILRKYVPDELINRPKMGFAIPLGAWLRGPLREWAEELLHSSRLAEEGIFNVGRIRSLWGRHLAESEDAANQLWGVLMYQAWRENR